jgi:hypothetical protein
MYAIEFETNITSPFIALHNYEQFLNQQVKVIVTDIPHPFIKNWHISNHMTPQAV